MTSRPSMADNDGTALWPISLVSAFDVARPSKSFEPGLCIELASFLRLTDKCPRRVYPHMLGTCLVRPDDWGERTS